MTVEDAAAMFDLPDFRPALGDYMIRLAGQNGEPFIKTVGGRRYSHQGCQLPFKYGIGFDCNQKATITHMILYLLRQ
jgi:hypothetical protein